MLTKVSIKLNILSGWSYGTMCPAPRTIAYVNDKANQGTVKQSKQKQEEEESYKTKETILSCVISMEAWKRIAQ